jgi:protein SCO1/2
MATNNRNVMLLIVVAAIAAAAGLWVGLGQRQGGDTGLQARMQGALLYPAPRPIDAFTLERADGGSFTNADLAGRWTIGFFGFTHCPDICPTTLALMKDVEQQIASAPLPQPLQLLFVSVDPERDTPEVLAGYAGFFSRDIVAATVAEPALRAFTTGLGIVYMQTPLDSGGYTVDHSAQIVVIDPQGRLAGMFRPPLDAARIAADLRTLAAS